MVRSHLIRTPLAYSLASLDAIAQGGDCLTTRLQSTISGGFKSYGGKPNGVN
jgi:hypothetical protein